MALPEGHEQAAPRVVEADAIGTAGQVEPARRLDAVADHEDEQGVSAGVGHVAPGPGCGTIHAGDVRRSHAGRRAAEPSSTCVAQLEHALAAQQEHRLSARQGGRFARRAGRRRQLRHVFRATRSDRRRRGEEQDGGHRTATAQGHAGSKRDGGHRTPTAWRYADTGREAGA
jgi:hypothetical protein